MRKTLTSHEVVTSLTDQGITLRVASLSSISEEAPMSYKDVEKVVDICKPRIALLTVRPQSRNKHQGPSPRARVRSKRIDLYF